MDTGMWWVDASPHVQQVDRITKGALPYVTITGPVHHAGPHLPGWCARHELGGTAGTRTTRRTLPTPAMEA